MVDLPDTWLFICPTSYTAEHAGFRRQDGFHPINPLMKAWWPGASERTILTGRWRCIVIDSGTRRFVYDQGRRVRDDFDRAVHMLRERQRAYGDAALWMEF